MSDLSILIVEDERDLAQRLASYATRRQYSVAIAPTLEDGLAKHEEKRAAGSDFTVMVVDLKLGADDYTAGWEFLKRAKPNSHTVVAVMTAHTDPQKLSIPLGVVLNGTFRFVRKTDPRGIDDVLNLLDTQAAAFQFRNARHPIIAESPSDIETLKALPVIAASGLPVLITGPTGSSKEFYAQEIARLTYPGDTQGEMVVLNCANTAEALAMSELFGHHRGSFSGAERDHLGAILRVSGYTSLRIPAGREDPVLPPDGTPPGTLILDEVAELRPRVQANLLRALDGYPVEPLGHSGPGFVPNFRVIACTNDERTLQDPTLFRADLLGRLNGWHIKVPSITERRSTARGIVRSKAPLFTMLWSAENQPRSITTVSDSALEVVDNHLSEIRYGARELIAWTHRACALALASGGTTLTAEHMEEAWKRRVQLAGDEPAAERSAAPSVGLPRESEQPLITDDIRARAESLRVEFVALFAEGGEQLASTWIGPDFKRGYERIRQSNQQLADRIVAKREDYSGGDQHRKLIVITAFREEHRVLESEGTLQDRMSTAITHIRTSYFRSQSRGRGRRAAE